MQILLVLSRQALRPETRARSSGDAPKFNLVPGTQQSAVESVCKQLDHTHHGVGRSVLRAQRQHQR